MIPSVGVTTSADGSTATGEVPRDVASRRGSTCSVAGRMSTRSHRPRIAVAVEVERELALDIGGDHGLWCELFLAEASQRCPAVASRASSCSRLTNPSFDQAEIEDLVQLRLRHHVPSCVAVVEHLDRLVQRGAVDERVMRRDGTRRTCAYL